MCQLYSNVGYEPEKEPEYSYMDAKYLYFHKLNDTEIQVYLIWPETNEGYIGTITCQSEQIDSDYEELNNLRANGQFMYYVKKHHEHFILFNNLAIPMEKTQTDFSVIYALDDKIDHLQTKIDEIIEKFNEKFDQIEETLDKLEKTINNIDKKLDTNKKID